MAQPQNNRPVDHAAVIDCYRERHARFVAEAGGWRRRELRVSWSRLILALAAIVSFVVAVVVDGAAATWAWLAVCGIFAVLFIAGVLYHQHVRQQTRRARTFARLNQHGLDRLERNWKALPVDDVSSALTDLPVARDLDLFGRASVFQLASTATTPLGQARLAQWLVEPAEPAVIEERQAAVGELAHLIEQRQKLAYLGLRHDDPLSSPEPFLDWAEGDAWLSSKRWLWFVRWLVPISFVVLLMMYLLGLAPGVLCALVPFVGLLLSMPYIARMHDVFERISRRQGEIATYVAMLELLASMPADTSAMKAVKRQAVVDGVAAHRCLDRLRRWMDASDLRYSQVYLPVQMLTMWDFHLLAGIERWQTHYGKYARVWIEAVAEFEALSSLASLSFEHPGWVFPTVQAMPAAETSVAAEQLGHPLLSEEIRVTNDVEVGPPGSFLLVTGSNMSGKSTLLRSIGTNLALAQAGSVVCAKSMQLAPVVIETSMRIQDSLEQGVSFFMAELRRLREVVQRAETQQTTGDRTLLFLLDEILQGTNSHERQIAVREVVRRLLEAGAIGCISTHDLHLADAPPLAEAARSVHFRENIVEQNGRREMTFDYQLHSGPATTTNALELLKLVGL